MRVAAYQAPFLPFGSPDGIALVTEQLAACAELGVDLLCCPEGVIGGVALEGDGQDPNDVALGVADGQLADVIAPWRGSKVAVVAGFTERDPHGRLFASAAVVGPDGLAGVYRKVFPGYRTAIQPGSELPIFDIAGVAVGVMICNDAWYPEPARILAARGAATILVPTNSGHIRDLGAATGLRSRGRSLPIARAVDTSTTVVVADVAGHQGGRSALGSSVIVDPDGAVIRAADPGATALLVADVADERPTTHAPRGWDGYTNPTVTENFLALWRDGHPAEPPPR